jgi:integrase
MAGRKKRRHGEGALWQEDRTRGRKVWMGQIRVAGKQKQKMLGNVKGTAPDGITRTQAEVALSAWDAAEREASNEQDEESQAQNVSTLTQVAEDHFGYVRAVFGRKERTVKDYRSIVQRHLVPYFGEDPKTIDSDQVEQFMEDKAAAGVSRGTILNVVNLLHAILKEAIRQGIVSTNAASDARKPPTPRQNKKLRYLLPEEVDGLLLAVPDDELAAFERTLYFAAAWTGLRRGELLALRVRNVSFAAGTIRVEEAWSPEDRQLDDPKSYESIRTIPMLTEVAQMLARRITDRGLRDDGLVFADPYVVGPPEHVGTTSWTKLYKRYRQALDRIAVPEGRKTKRFHDLRHTFGSQMAAGGAEIIKISEWMGHADIQTTMVYVQFVPRKRDQALMQRAYASARDNGSVTAVDLARNLAANGASEANVLQNTGI